MPAPRRRILGVCLALAVVGAGSFANNLDGPFIFDDLATVEHNPSIRHLWPPWDILRPPRASPAAARPVGNLSLAVDYALGGTAVRGYHLTNIVVHVLCALTLFGVVRRTLCGGRLRPRFGAAATGIAAAAALIWMVHPLQTEVVNY